MFICPVCKSALLQKDKSYVCKNGHCYDISKKGYVNLLMSQASSSRHHGDDKTMAIARREFLNSNHYAPLCNAICSFLTKGSILDIGCGECYYLSEICKQNPKIIGYGIDISKEILEVASARVKPLGIKTAVASGAHLPFADQSFDYALSVFAPVTDLEVFRVLKKGGTLIRVFPLKEHLFELKSAVYKNAVYNMPNNIHTNGFEIIDTKALKYSFCAKGEQIKNLFTMTPYYYKTSKDDIKKLNCINSLNITAEFEIVVYKKVL